MSLESRYQAQLIGKLKRMFPGCIVLKLDPDYLQGIPDLCILYQGYWAILEVKADESAPSQPNQDHYIDVMGKMSFASYIYPEIEEEVLGALQQAFEPPRRTRVSIP